MPKPQILIIDDEQDFLNDLNFYLNNNFRCNGVTSAEHGISKLETNKYDAILLDIDLGNRVDGFEFLKTIRQQENFIPVIIISKDHSIQTVVKAMQLGACNYVGKDPDTNQLKTIIQSAIDQEQKKYREPVTDDLSHLSSILVGDSDAMQRLREQIVKFTRFNSNVLIIGESGTGKELVARQIHELSPRKEKSFIAVNCAAIPITLFESEFFGHEKGAFTGAARRRYGWFELADQGTLFLDEIAEMELPLQAKLLRVLEDGTFFRVGGEQKVEVDIRVIAATNSDLDALKEAGQFRTDLYYRLNVAPIFIQPLRERRKDIPSLVNSFIKRLNKQVHKSITGFSPQALNYLMKHSWPGNVRELQHTVERAMLYSDDTIITKSVLENTMTEPQTTTSYITAKEEFQREYIETVLSVTNGNITHAAKHMQITRQGLQKMMKQLNIESPQNRSRA